MIFITIELINYKTVRTLIIVPCKVFYIGLKYVYVYMTAGQSYLIIFSEQQTCWTPDWSELVSNWSEIRWEFMSPCPSAGGRVVLHELSNGISLAALFPLTAGLTHWLLAASKSPPMGIYLCGAKSWLRLRVCGNMTNFKNMIWQLGLSGPSVLGKFLNAYFWLTMELFCHYIRLCARMWMWKRFTHAPNAGAWSHSAAFRSERPVGFIQLPPCYLSSPSVPVPFSLFGFEEKWHLWSKLSLQLHVHMSD